MEKVTEINFENFDTNILINELLEFEEYSNIEFNKISEYDIRRIFAEHCEKYSEYIEIGGIHDNMLKTDLLTSTPDGWQRVGNFYKKTPRDIYKIITTNCEAEISQDHYFEGKDKWIKTSELKINDILLTINGYEPVKSIELISNEEVYDWEILHDNHRYWAGGISSHNTGKSFLCLNIAREAQKIGYDVIYCDTEGAIDKTGAIKFGIDPNKIRYQPIQTVSQFQTFVSNLIKIVKKAKEENHAPKILLVLDSLGMLSTDKELSDAIKGHNAADMGSKAKELRKLFRVITLDLTAAKIPLICTNHVYTGGGYIPSKESSGGDGPIFAMSVVSFLSKAQLKDGSGTKTGIIVTSNLKKSRFTIPEQVKFHISFSRGMNPYVGLQDYVSWEACGIERGKFEEVKNNDGKKETVFKPSATAQRWGVKHLGKTVSSSELFSEKVFTQDVLKELDNNVIKNKFKFPDRNDIEDIIDDIDDTENDISNEDGEA